MSCLSLYRGRKNPAELYRVANQFYRKDASAYTSLPYSLLGLTRLWNYRWEGLKSNHRGLGKRGKLCNERTESIAGIKTLWRRTDCDRTIRVYNPRAVETNRISSAFATFQGYLYHIFAILESEQRTAFPSTPIAHPVTRSLILACDS